MKKFIAEFIGSTFLIATILGTNLLAVSINGDSSAGHLAHALSIGSILAVMIIIFGPISGGHFNPAVTISFLAKGDINVSQCIQYIIAQSLGAILGAILANTMYGYDLISISSVTRSGGGILLGELIATFGLVLLIHLTLKFKEEAVPYAVGLFIFAAVSFTSSTAFANPAVSLGRIFSSAPASIAISSAIIFIVVQIIAGLIAFYVARFLLEKES